MEGGAEGRTPGRALPCLKPPGCLPPPGDPHSHHLPWVGGGGEGGAVFNFNFIVIGRPNHVPKNLSELMLINDNS